MPRVIVFDMGLTKVVIARGVTDGKIVDQHYMKVDGELFNAACIIEETSEAECALEAAVKSIKAAEDAAAQARHVAIRYLRMYRQK